MRRGLMIATLLGTTTTLPAGAARAAFILNADVGGTGSFQVYDQTAHAYDPVVADNGAPIPGGFRFVVPIGVGPGDIGIDDADGALVGLIRFVRPGSGTVSTVLDLFGPGGLPADAQPSFSIVAAADGTARFVGGDGTAASTNFFNISGLNPVPEPSSFALAGLGGLGLLAWARRRARKRLG